MERVMDEQEHDEQDTAEELEVWMSDYKKRVYHVPLRTVTGCGQYMGDKDADGIPLRGRLFPQSDPIVKAARPCSKCFAVTGGRIL